MKDILSVKELLALLIRKGRLIVCAVLVFGLCFGGVRAFRVSRSASGSSVSEEEYEQALADYEREKSALQMRLDNKKKALSGQLAYNTESVLMQLDAYNEAVTALQLTAVSENGEDAGLLSTVLLNRFVLAWGSLDLQQVYAGSPFADIPDKYLREITEISLTDGGSMQLYAYAADTETSRALVDIAYQWVLSYADTLRESFGDFELAILSNNSKILKSDILLDKQTNNINAVTDLKREISDAEKELDALRPPKQSSSVSASALLRSALKWAILGAAAGGVLSAGLVFVVYLFTGKAENSRRMELGLDTVCLGSAAEEGSLWVRLGNRTVGEKAWKNAGVQQEYLRESLCLHTSADSRIAVLSTLDIDESDPAVQKLLTALRDGKRSVEFVGNALLDPKTAGALTQCDSVILAERVDSSRWERMTALQTQAERQNRPLLGFVLV